MKEHSEHPMHAVGVLKEIDHPIHAVEVSRFMKVI
jgi:hypothetical protein